jgi:PD-(D/E)XK nuclease superfamily protein
MTLVSVAPESKKRYVSNEELRTLFNCEAQWDFRYGDRLAGDSLKPLTDVDRLVSGSIWDRLAKSYNRNGIYPKSREAMQDLCGFSIELAEYEKQLALIRRYSSMNRPIRTTEVAEYRVAVSPILDLWVSPDDLYASSDGLWYIDYKLRASLTSVEYLQRNMQGMLYVWGARKAGIDIKGIIFDETLNEMPAEVRYNKDGRPSKVQTCSASDYLKGCVSGGYLPDPEIIKKLEDRKVHQRVVVDHFDFDLDTIEATIQSAYTRITFLENGLLYPTRTRNSMICRYCRYNNICEFPEPDYIDFLYERKPAKRYRGNDRT